MRLLLCVFLSCCLTGNAAAQFSGAKFDGQWLGTLDAGAAKLRVVFHLDKGTDGKLTGTMDSLDQGAKGIPLGEITVEGQHITIAIPNVRGTFDAKLSPAGNDLEGTWSQGTPLPLKLSRVDTIPTARRPQNPTEPFPYDQQEVTVEVKAVKLGGTLTIPKGPGPYPAVVLLTGSGPQDRDETLLEHKPFLVIADHLTRNGFAVLRLDDRGVGKSTGVLGNSTLSDLADDAIAATQYLKTQPKIDGQNVGLIGHSEGGTVAPIAANRTKDIAFLVLLAGTAVPGEQVIYEQSRLIARAMGASDALVTEQITRLKSIYEIVRTENDPDQLKERLRDLPGAKNLIPTLTSTNFRSLLTHDPAVELRKLSVPVLAIFGSRDLQVPPKQNFGAMAAAMADSGNPDITLAVLPGLNHLFQSAKSGMPTEYASIEETFAPRALDIVTAWLQRHTR